MCLFAQNLANFPLPEHSSEARGLRQMLFDWLMLLGFEDVDIFNSI
jgi:hypothetical protein